jgi:Bacterial PH domain
MPQQERFGWSLWPVAVGWVLALWLAWHGLDDLKVLARGDAPFRGIVFQSLASWPRAAQQVLAGVQIALVLLALPSFVGWATRRMLLSVGATGVTLERWRGFRRLDWADIERLEFHWGDALFSVREAGRLTRCRFRPWTIGMDTEQFRALIERHQPRLTPDEDDGQPWGRSSSFNS